jgi:hypothetical protein
MRANRRDADLGWQIGTGYFGCRIESDEFELTDLREHRTYVYAGLPAALQAVKDPGVDQCIGCEGRNDGGHYRKPVLRENI